MSRSLSYEALLAAAVRQLTGAGVPDAELDGWYLLSDTFGISRADYLWKRWDVPERIPDSWPERIQKRCERMPLGYVLGNTEFMGLPFIVEPGVLIPRQDTESLVEWVLEQDKAGGRLLDMCTGSGCIGLSLAKLGGFAVTLSDLSETAITVSAKNREALHLTENVQICRGDLFGSLPEGVCFDVIVSNPPYIESWVIEGLQEEVRDYEPRMALDGMEDGLYFYRRLAQEAPDYLAQGGRIYLEIGYDQGVAVPELLREAGFTQIEVRKDLAGNDRVVRGVYSDV